MQYSRERRVNPNLPPPPGVTVLRRDGSTEGAPVNPMGLAMAGMAAAKAGVTTPISDAFSGSSKQPAQKGGYKVVG